MYSLSVKIEILKQKKRKMAKKVFYLLVNFPLLSEVLNNFDNP